MAKLINTKGEYGEYVSLDHPDLNESQCGNSKTIKTLFVWILPLILFFVLSAINSLVIYILIFRYSGMVEQRNNLLSTQCFIKLGFVILKNKFISDAHDSSIFDSDIHLEKSEIYRDKFTVEFERRQKLLKYDPILAFFIYWFFSTIAIATIKMPPLKELKFNLKNLINFYTVLFLFNTFLIGIIAFSEVFFNDCYYGI
uniref:Uncharacterized protein n=1 Tax=Panagrolaimus sp. JU765 TaxID=591449 RepID=A0AC34Q258_9BILA